MKIYAGVGSRTTPGDVRAIMFSLGAQFAQRGWTLRSGHADGADISFEDGCRSVGGKSEVFLPWPGFNDAYGPDYKYAPWQLKEELEAIAAQYHPAWNKLTSGARKLHTRNVCQLLGSDLNTPVDIVVCWTPGGKITGGTGQVLRMAVDKGIPIHNLYNAYAREAIQADIREAEFRC